VVPVGDDASSSVPRQQLSREGVTLSRQHPNGLTKGAIFEVNQENIPKIHLRFYPADLERVREET
jgi:hypothetical protein